ncbi:hypothetical protein [Roseobacter weihaiensis]|uniref:hypothetical protein n=1 Tax=Roseobacter weihaiensis TaxID=2763262 RepID=UPI001D0B0121|nr:hypothetical protein [Roseobacter sp. H9]
MTGMTTAPTRRFARTVSELEWGASPTKDFWLVSQFMSETGVGCFTPRNPFDVRNAIDQHMMKKYQNGDFNAFF